MASNAPSPLPRFIYKITPAPPPDPSRLSIRCPQIPITAGLWFKDATEFWVLKIKLAPRFENHINWDVPGCPHLYGNFGAEDVDSVRKFQREEGQIWNDALEPSVSWLE
ncbi:hypothetical protein GGTG_09908 [Gaeumannomyces tritici R3-111a-1]|uniref:Uncharacterized protein n=1 Tax=Gaeumannomyces tritici (strain R3-111a-1) TaxID=644352 RepID=J3P8S3_GAET3|nr:hypothetical protein GGTG_09908 [Gaeumannomyces tritici R3-111a-1]EJT73057.1 hypothetical protein GGTG_09908 [Gaeumannomyces tritici R3-111a-1]